MFVLCTVLFSNTYNSEDHKHLSFVDDIFEGYSWGIDIHEENLNKLEMCKAKVNEIRWEGKSKRKLV